MAPLSPEQALFEAQVTSEQLLAEATARAQAILEEAEQQAAAVQVQTQQQGLAQGRAEGLRQGTAKAQADNAEVAGRLAALAGAAEQEVERVFAQAEPQLVDLALAIARRIVGAELAANPVLVAEVVAKAIDEARGAGHHTIHLHPDDVRLIGTFLPQAAIDAGGREWELVPDGNLSRGDCYIETALGSVDARLETQFREFETLLRGGIDAESPAR
ncbi:MAG: FliH/SctL family protein [Anaerolineae bacterium]